MIRPDARGQGASVAPPASWTLDDFTNDLASIMDQLHLPRAHLAGFSMGGLIAQAFALRFPKRVGKLAILAATTGRSANEQTKLLQRLEFIRRHHPIEYFDTVAAPRWFTDAFRAARPDVVDYCRRVVAGNNHSNYISAYEVLVANDLIDQIGNIRHETLVLTAENDLGAGPAVARRISDAIKGSKLIIFPRLKHHILLEAPDAVGSILREFFPRRSVGNIVT